MEVAFQLVQFLVGVATLVTMVWGLIRMFANTREAKNSRIISLTASRNAEYAATTALTHAKENSTKIDAMAENVQKVELATNSMKDALIAATAEASFAAGEKSEREKSK